MKDDANPSDYIQPQPSTRGTLPPQAKIWQVAGPHILMALLVIATFTGAMLGKISPDFLEKFIGWVLVGIFAGSTPSGVMDVVRRMTGIEPK